MKSFTGIILRLFLLPPMALAISRSDFTVEVCFELNGGPVVDALVKCYDADWAFGNDRVGPSDGAKTDKEGCAYLEDNQWWLEDPDIYCTIEPNGDCFGEYTTYTMRDHEKYTDASFRTISLEFDEFYCGDFLNQNGVNGCGPGYLPSWSRKFLDAIIGFEVQCAGHDICYDDCTKTRSECDDKFLDDMAKACSLQGGCETLASLLYIAVDNGGEHACKDWREDIGCNPEGIALCSE